MHGNYMNWMHDWRQNVAHLNAKSSNFKHKKESFWMLQRLGCTILHMLLNRFGECKYSDGKVNGVYYVGVYTAAS